MARDSLTFLLIIIGLNYRVYAATVIPNDVTSNDDLTNASTSVDPGSNTGTSITTSFLTSTSHITTTNTTTTTTFPAGGSNIGPQNSMDVTESTTNTTQDPEKDNNDNNITTIPTPISSNDIGTTTISNTPVQNSTLLTTPQSALSSTKNSSTTFTMASNTNSTLPTVSSSNTSVIITPISTNVSTTMLTPIHAATSTTSSINVSTPLTTVSSSTTPLSNFSTIPTTTSVTTVKSGILTTTTTTEKQEDKTETSDTDADVLITGKTACEDSTFGKLGLAVFIALSVVCVILMAALIFLILKQTRRKKQGETVMEEEKTVPKLKMLEIKDTPVKTYTKSQATDDGLQTFSLDYEQYVQQKKEEHKRKVANTNSVNTTASDGPAVSSFLIGKKPLMMQNTTSSTNSSPRSPNSPKSPLGMSGDKPGSVEDAPIVFNFTKTPGESLAARRASKHDEENKRRSSTGSAKNTKGLELAPDNFTIDL